MTLGRVRTAGDTVTLETVIVTSGVYSRSMWLLHTDATGLVDEVVLYSTGPWSADTVARQAREGR